MKIVDVIKCEGDNKTFIWKYEEEDFNTLSQLVVHESQEALLFLGGQALDLFGPGTHTLHTKNIPLLNKIINLPMGGVSPFHCEVYFINKTEQTNVKWGMGDVNYLDPQNNDYAFKIGAHGTMNLKISDARKVVTKLVGTEREFNQENIKETFKTPIKNCVKTMLPALLREKNLSIFEVENCLEDLSGILKFRISEEMADYGISLEKFWIEAIEKPEDDATYIDLNRQRGEKVRLKNQGELDIQRAGYQKEVGIIEHSGKVQQRRMDIDTEFYEQQRLGFTYEQKRQFDVMETMAGNEGGAGFSNAVMGIGMGVGMAGTVRETFRSISKDTIIPETTEREAAGIPRPVPKKAEPSVDSWICSCGIVNKGKFCFECGAKKPSEDWICSCGSVNSGNFCPECGKARTEN